MQFLRNQNIALSYDVYIGSPRAGKTQPPLVFLNIWPKEWEKYIGLLCENLIILDDEIADSLCWSKNPKDGTFTAKLGYKAWQEEKFEGSKKWWWGPIWKTKAPPRCKITLWLALNNKLLTWDNGLKRGWSGPGRCPLCKSDSESIAHLFIYFPYAAQVMKTVKDQLTNLENQSPSQM
jgi:hypothetical protein